MAAKKTRFSILITLLLAIVAVAIARKYRFELEGE
jgi:hypothetical protein